MRQQSYRCAKSLSFNAAARLVGEAERGKLILEIFSVNPRCIFIAPLLVRLTAFDPFEGLFFPLSFQLSDSHTRYSLTSYHLTSASHLFPPSIAFFLVFFITQY
jgi:hypothetical protein